MRCESMWWSFAIPRNSQFGLLMKPLVAWPCLRHDPFNSWSRKHFVPPPTLCTIQMILPFPFPLKLISLSSTANTYFSSPSPTFNTCWLLTPYVPHVCPLISLACHVAPALISPLGPCLQACLQLASSNSMVKSIPPLLDPRGNPYPHYPHSTHMLCFPFWPYHTQIHWTAFFSFYPFPIHQATGLMAMWSPCTIPSCQCMSCTILIFCCDMDLVLSLVWYLSPAATITTTSGIGGVQIPITLVSSTTGLFTSKRSSIWTVQIVDLDFRSEFLCQSSNLSQNLQIPLNHLICLGYLPCPCNPVSPICPQTQCSYRVPQTEAAQAESQTSEL